MKRFLIVCWALTLVACSKDRPDDTLKPAGDDLVPTKLSSVQLIAEQPAEPEYKATPLTADRAYRHSGAGDIQISTAMTHWFMPGQAPELLELSFESGSSMVIVVSLYDAAEIDESLMNGLALLDVNEKPMTSKTHALSVSNNQRAVYDENIAQALEMPLSFPARIFKINEVKSSGRLPAKPKGLRIPNSMRKNLLGVHVYQPAATLTLAAAVESQSYQPGDHVRVDFELTDEADAELVVEGVEARVDTDRDQVPLSTDVVLTTKHSGYVKIALPEEARTGHGWVTLVAKGKINERSFARSTRVVFDVVRPHAEIVRLEQSIVKSSGRSRFEVDVTLRSLSLDRFEVFGVLTGRSEAGYEVPVARAFVAFDGVANGLTTGTLVFDLDSVRHSVVSGPFLLRDLVLKSFHTGTVQHRIGVVEGIETPEGWGLAGNQALNDAMCNLLVEAGNLEAGQCQ